MSLAVDEVALSELNAGEFAPLTPADVAALRWDDLAPAKPKRRDDTQTDEGFFDSWDSTKLFWQSWTPAATQPWRAQIALIHGYGEHSSRYEHFGTILARAGFGVMAMDVRGHGRSAGVPAHVDRYDDYVRDVERLISFMQKRWQDKQDRPLFVFGHSNGGLITLRYALRRPEQVSAFAVTSPMCGLSVQIPAWKAKAGKLLSKLKPTFALPSELDAKDLTHDAHVCEVYKDDPLNRAVATARWFTEAQSAFGDLYERAELIKQPIMGLIGGSDRIVDAKQSERVFERISSEDKQSKVYAALYHELLNELEWAEIATKLILWFDEQRIKATPASDSPKQAQEEE